MNLSDFTPGFARAQRDYETPPEPVEHDYSLDVTVTFYLTLDGCTFDVGSQNDQAKDFVKDDLVPVLTRAIEKSGYLFAIPRGGIESEYEITEVRP